MMIVPIIGTFLVSFAFGRSKTCEELVTAKLSKPNLSGGDFISLGWPQKNFKLKSGNTASFTCSHIGYRGGDPSLAPPVQLIWMKGKNTLDKTDKRIEITGCNKKPLILGTRFSISNLTAQDSGVYHCDLWYSENRTENELLFQENFTLRIVADNHSVRKIENASRSTYDTATTNHSLFGDMRPTSTDKSSTKTLLLLLISALVCVGFILAITFLRRWKSSDQQRKNTTVRIRSQLCLPCKKFLEFSNENHEPTGPEPVVRYQNDATDCQPSIPKVETIEGNISADQKAICNKEAICQKFTTLYPFLTEKDVKEIFEFEIHREKLQCNLEHSMPIILGTGNFGQVFEGTITDHSGIQTPVAVKRLNDGYKTEELGNFLREIVILIKAGQHINVVSLKGTIVLDCIDNMDEKYPLIRRPAILIMELANGGNLRKFLHDSRFNFLPHKTISTLPDTKANGLEIRHLLSFAYQAARGMEHLESRNILHRDLAARNVLLTDQLVVKIADFGLSKFMTQEKQYYRVNHQRITPAKWTAPESLWSNKFTVKSDVWSYGVLLWEILSLGEQPYSTVPFCKLWGYLSAGNRLSRPYLAPIDTYQTMLQCWAWDPNARPGFSKLVQVMSKHLESALDPHMYIDFSLLSKPKSEKFCDRYGEDSCNNSITTSSNDSSYESDVLISREDGEYDQNDRGGEIENNMFMYEVMNPLYEEDRNLEEKTRRI